MIKKNGKLKVCMDFKNLNLATPNNKSPMPIADMLIDGGSKASISIIY